MKLINLEHQNVPSDEDQYLAHLEGKLEESNHCGPLVQGCNHI